MLCLAIWTPLKDLFVTFKTSLICSPAAWCIDIVSHLNTGHWTLNIYLPCCYLQIVITVLASWSLIIPKHYHGVGNTCDSYLTGHGYKSQPGDWLTLQDSHVFFSLYRLMEKQYLNLGYDHFLPYLFQFIIFNNSILHRTEKCIKNSQQSTMRRLCWERSLWRLMNS